MSEYTPITGELRERIGQAEHIVPLSGDSKDTQVRINLAWLEEKLDAIDSIHAQLEREYEDLRMKYVNMNRHAQHVERENESLKTELDRVLGEQENRDGWVELPKDADGVPIRFKDKVTVPWSDKVYEVSGFSYHEYVHTGTMTIWINTHIDGNYRALCATDSCHHYTPDTWEQIIEDALDGYHDTDFEKLVARCKKLAGDAE